MMDKNLDFLMSLNLVPGVLICTPDDERSERVVEPLNASLANDGDVIYNGDNEKFLVPVLSKMKDLFSVEAIDGWPTAERLTLIDLDRIAPEHHEEMLLKYLDHSTVAPYKGTFTDPKRWPQFVTHSAAIRVNQHNGHWFEMIFNKTK